MGATIVDWPTLPREAPTRIGDEVDIWETTVDVDTPLREPRSSILHRRHDRQLRKWEAQIEKGICQSSQSLRLLGAASNRPILLEAGSETFLVSEEMAKDDRSILGPHTLSMNPYDFSDLIMALELHRPRLVFVWQPTTVNQRFCPRWLEQVRRLSTSATSWASSPSRRRGGPQAVQAMVMTQDHVSPSTTSRCPTP